MVWCLFLDPPTTSKEESVGSRWTIADRSREWNPRLGGSEDEKTRGGGKEEEEEGEEEGEGEVEDEEETRSRWKNVGC